MPRSSAKREVCRYRLLERADGLGVLSVGLVHGAVHLERLVDLLGAVDQDAPEAQPQHDADVAIALAVRGVDRLAEGRHDLVPALGDLGGTLDVFARLLVAREELERRLGSARTPSADP